MIPDAHHRPPRLEEGARVAVVLTVGSGPAVTLPERPVERNERLDLSCIQVSTSLRVIKEKWHQPPSKSPSMGHRPVQAP